MAEAVASSVLKSILAVFSRRCTEPLNLPKYQKNYLMTIVHAEIVLKTGPYITYIPQPGILPRLPVI